MIVLIILFIIGFIVSSFTLLPSVICITFGIPITRKLQKYALLKKNNPIIKKYMLSITVLTTIYLIILGIVIISNPLDARIGFIIGSFLSILFSITKLGYNPNNLSDYLQTQNIYFEQPPLSWNHLESQIKLQEKLRVLKEKTQNN